MGSACGAIAGHRAPPGGDEQRSRSKTWFQFVSIWKQRRLIGVKAREKQRAKEYMERQRNGR